MEQGVFNQLDIEMVVRVFGRKLFLLKISLEL